jgi:hypothetical protein
MMKAMAINPSMNRGSAKNLTPTSPTTAEMKMKRIMMFTPSIESRCLIMAVGPIIRCRMSPVIAEPVRMAKSFMPRISGDNDN